MAGELKPYPWILAAFVSLSYVCAGRKGKLEGHLIVLAETTTQILILYLPWATKETETKNEKL